MLLKWVREVLVTSRIGALNVSAYVWDGIFQELSLG